MGLRRLSIALDLKKNRIRIHKITLHRLGDPKRVQLLFNPEKRELLISCPSKSISESQDEKVYFDKPGTDGTYQLYSSELIKRIQGVCPDLENKALYYACGKYVPSINAAIFQMDDCIKDTRYEDKQNGRTAED